MLELQDKNTAAYYVSSSIAYSVTSECLFHAQANRFGVVLSSRLHGNCRIGHCSTTGSAPRHSSINYDTLQLHQFAQHAAQLKQLLNKKSLIFNLSPIPGNNLVAGLHNKHSLPAAVFQQMQPDPTVTGEFDFVKDEEEYKNSKLS